jgi:pimeloyl-ACP methyl ester carboxylesterase
LFRRYARAVTGLPRLVLVHGSVVSARMTWGAQRPLSRRFQLVAPDRRGFPPNPPVEYVDFEEEAESLAPLLDGGAHLAGHSYGGLIALLMAVRRPDEVRSLTVIEPPAFGLARGNPVADSFDRSMREHWTHGPRDPDAFVRWFLPMIGSDFDPPRPLPAAIEQGARTLMVERSPGDAEVPLDVLAAAPFPKLVVSGAHNPALEAVCDVLEQRLGAERAVLPGAGHVVQRAPGFNDVFLDFLERAS